MKARAHELMLYVAAGCAALTEYFGNQDWVDRIDLDAFDYEHTDFCIAGQLFRREAKPCDGTIHAFVNPWSSTRQEELGLRPGEWTDICAKAAFNLPKKYTQGSDDTVIANYKLMGNCWKKTIKHLKDNRVKVKTVIITNVDVAVAASCQRTASFGS